MRFFMHKLSQSMKPSKAVMQSMDSCKDSAMLCTSPAVTGNNGTGILGA